MQTTNRLAEKGSTATTRRQSLMQLQDIRDNLYELSSEDFKELREEEYFEVKQILQEIRDLAFKLSK